MVKNKVLYYLAIIVNRIIYDSGSRLSVART